MRNDGFPEIHHFAFIVHHSPENIMAVTVLIPTPLRKLTNEQEKVTVNGLSVGEVIDDLGRQYPGIKDRICDADGELRRFVNVYVNGEDVRFEGGKAAAVKDGDEVSIVPAIAGGRI
jgi:molybdopterin synthase sulfur carrier subunit